MPFQWGKLHIISSAYLILRYCRLATSINIIVFFGLNNAVILIKPPASLCKHKIIIGSAAGRGGSVAEYDSTIKAHNLISG